VLTQSAPRLRDATRPMSSFRAGSMSTACGVALIDNKSRLTKQDQLPIEVRIAMAAAIVAKSIFFIHNGRSSGEASLGEIAALVIDLDCATAAGRVLWGRAPELLNI